MISEFVEQYDSQLFAKRDNRGIISIYRNRKVLDSFEYEGVTYKYFRDAPYHIVFLTDNWAFNGKPVDWGLDQLWMKLNKMDNWKPENDALQEVNKHNEKIDEIEAKDFHDQNVAFFSETRTEWKKAFKDYNISSHIEKERKVF